MANIRDDLLQIQQDVRRLKVGALVNPLRTGQQAVDLLDNLITVIDALNSLWAVALNDHAERIAALQALLFPDDEGAVAVATALSAPGCAGAPGNVVSLRP